ncbi:MAG: S-layer homology domain-containing protein [bacterium]|nr:S-layer homology domain-containing protein [bacterium]
MGKIKRYSCGAVFSPPDSRDYKFASLGGANAAVEPYQSIVPVGEVWNQLNSNQCGGCAGTYYRREREFMQTGDDSRFSHTYIYGSDDFGGEGMFARNLASILRIGIPHMQPWEAWNSKPQAQMVVSSHSRELAEECHLFRCNSYYFCMTWTEVLNAIRVCNGCVLMVACYDNWNTYNGVVGKNKGNLWGYHFVFAKDYVKKDNGAYRIRFVNSWGKEWGDNGCGYLDTDVNEFEEAFAIVDNVEEIKRMLFKDVKTDRWSYDSIQKAAKKGVMTGFEDGTFRPEASLTREQLAVVLDRAGFLDRLPDAE